MSREKKAEKNNYDLHTLNTQTRIIESMATLVESRDLNTGEHISRTGTFYAMITDKLREDHVFPELEDEIYVSDIKNGSALHDIGKIFISDVILNKPGRLTSEEFEIIKTHTTLGARIVDELFSDNIGDTATMAIRDIVLYHHEKWDGSGYPQGLKGDSIPLAARIMAVADVFDALLSKRPYKKAFSLNTAYDIIEQDAGRHFDKRIVKAFTDIRPEIESYVENSAPRESDLADLYSEQIEESTRRVTVVNKLVDEYESIYMLNLETQKIYAIKASDLQSEKNSELSYSGLMEEIAESSAEKYRKTFRSFGDPEYLSAYMHKDDRREFIFHLSDASGGSLRRCTLQVASRKDDEPYEIVISFMKVDDERAKNIQLTEELERNYDIIEILASEFLAVYYVDVDKDEMIPYSNNESAERIMVGKYKNDTCYSRSIERYARTCVHPDYIEMISKAGSIENIRRELEHQKSYSRIYMNDFGGYREMKIVKVGAANDPVNTVAVGFIDNDELYRKELETRRAERFIAGLTGDYEAVFHVDADAGTVETVRLTDAYALRNPGLEEKMAYRDFLHVVSQNIYPADRRQFILKQSMRYVEEQFRKTDVFFHNYRVINDEGIVEYHQLKIIHTDDWEDEHHFLIGIHNVDTLVKSELAQRKSISKTVNSADLDEITNVYNRKGFYNQARKLLEKNKKKGVPTYVMYFDIDHLALLNESFGRSEGDRCLIAVSAVVENAIRNRGIIGRLDNDEFAVALTCRERDTDLDADYFKRAARKALRRYNDHSLLPYNLNVSIGGCMVLPTDGYTLEKAIEFANIDRLQEKAAEIEMIR